MTGFGLDQGVQMGPVISQVSRQRILSLIDRGVQEGAKVLVDGRGKTVTDLKARRKPPRFSARG